MRYILLPNPHYKYGYFNSVKEDGTVVIDGGSPLVVTDYRGGDPQVFHTFTELEEAEGVLPRRPLALPEGLEITG